MSIYHWYWWLQLKKERKTYETSLLDWCMQMSDERHVGAIVFWIVSICEVSRSENKTVESYKWKKKWKKCKKASLLKTINRWLASRRSWRAARTNSLRWVWEVGIQLQAIWKNSSWFKSHSGAVAANVMVCSTEGWQIRRHWKMSWSLLYKRRIVVHRRVINHCHFRITVGEEWKRWRTSFGDVRGDWTETNSVS